MRQYKIRAVDYGYLDFAYNIQDSLVQFLNAECGKNIKLINSENDGEPNTERSLLSFTTAKTRDRFVQFLLTDLMQEITQIDFKAS